MKKVSLILLTVFAVTTVSAVGQSYSFSQYRDRIPMDHHRGLVVYRIPVGTHSVKVAKDAEERKQWKITRFLNKVGRHIGQNKKAYFIALPTAIVAALAAFAYKYDINGFGAMANSCVVDPVNDWGSETLQQLDSSIKGSELLQQLKLSIKEYLNSWAGKSASDYTDLVLFKTS